MSTSSFLRCNFLILWAMMGCSSQSGHPEPMQVSGKVIFQGKPVTTGEIRFLSDGAPGNQEPVAMTLIQDGGYRTTGGTGLKPGFYLVEITRAGMAKTIPYTQSIELKPGDSVKDFDIP